MVLDVPSRLNVSSPLILVSSTNSSLATESAQKLAKTSMSLLDISEPSIRPDGYKRTGALSWAASTTGGMVCVLAVRTEVTAFFTSWSSDGVKDACFSKLPGPPGPVAGKAPAVDVSEAK